MGTHFKNGNPNPLDVRKGISLCGILSSVLLCIGYFSATIDTIPVTEPNFYILLALASAISIPVYFLLDKAVDSLRDATPDSAIKDVNAKSTLPVSVLSLGARICLHWIPYFILLFPGIIFWDTGDQLAQFFGISAFGMESGFIWDHHPFFDTYLWGTIVAIFKSLTGSYSIGIYFLGIIQCLLASATFSTMLHYMRYRKVSRHYTRLIYYFVSYFPVFPIMFIGVVKDTTNILFFLQWVLVYIEIINSKGEVLKNKRIASLFVILTLLSALTKKITIYIILASLIPLIFSKLTKLARSLIICVSLGTYILLQLVIPTFLYPLIHVVPGGPQAAITVPIEQVARVAHYYPNDCTQAERQAIDGYLLTGWDQMSENYNPYTADSVTGFNVKDRSGTINFLKAWISIGLRHPATYINAFFSLESGWLSFGTSQGTNSIAYTTVPPTPVQMQVLTYSKTNDQTFGMLQENVEPSELNTVVSTIYEFLLSVPGLNIFFYIAIWTCVLPFYFVHRMHIRAKELNSNKGRRVIETLPYIFSVLSLFLYSVSLSVNMPENPSRYMFHTIVLAPLFFGYVFLPSEKRNQQLSDPKEIQLHKQGRITQESLR